MATTPTMSMPQGGSQPAPAAAPQASPLQQTLAQIAKGLEQLAQQNPIIQPELSQMRSLAIQCLQKTMMASQPQPAPAPADASNPQG